MGYSDKEKQREYNRQWIAKRRAEYLEDKACVICGSTTNLEVDHIDPKQKISHNVWSWSKIRRLTELAKCQILCNTHHKEKTARQRAEAMTHGYSMYVNKKCRCSICRAAKSEQNAKRY